MIFSVQRYDHKKRWAATKKNGSLCTNHNIYKTQNDYSTFLPLITLLFTWYLSFDDFCIISLGRSPLKRM